MNGGAERSARGTVGTWTDSCKRMHVCVCVCVLLFFMANKGLDLR